MQTLLDELSALYPSTAALAKQLLQLREAADARSESPFFEPKTVFQVTQEKPAIELIQLDGGNLHAWVNHIAASTRIRLRTGQEGSLSEILGDRTITTMTLVRAHLEAAAKSCLCLQTVREAGTTGDLSKLRTLYHRTLFGTSMLKAAKNLPAVDELLREEEREAISACQAVASLDAFYYQATDFGPASHLYSLLCEYAHPNQRGTADCVTLLEETPDGWHLAYSADRMTENAAAQALEALVLGARAGFASAQILEAYAFHGIDDSLIIVPPSEDTVRYAWIHLLQREPP